MATGQGAIPFIEAQPLALSLSKGGRLSHSCFDKLSTNGLGEPWGMGRSCDKTIEGPSLIAQLPDCPVAQLPQSPDYPGTQVLRYSGT